MGAASPPWAGVVSRREVLKRAGMVGVVISLPAGTVTSPVAFAAPALALTAAQSATLDAVLERLIPSDATGPGAKEARVGRYIRRSLAGEFKGLRGLYRRSLAAVDRYATGKFGAAFASLAPGQQDSILTDLETNAATGFAGGSKAFFETVREHALQGMFGDPYHGGNAKFAGWDLLGFPGIRLTVTSSEQRIGVRVKPAHKSTTDYAIFKISKRG